MYFQTEELLIAAVADLIGDVRHVAVGNASPIPATAALLARARGNGRPYVSLLQSRKHNFFTDGGRELFDCAGQGRIDVFFLSGGEIDGDGNINLVSIGDHEQPDGALSRLVRLGLSLFRGAEGDPVPHRTFPAHAGAEGRVSSARRAAAPPNVASHRRADRAHHQPLPVLLRPRAPALRAGRACIPATASDEVAEHTGFDTIRRT